MRTQLLAVAICRFVLLLPTFADELNKKGETAVAREIDLRNYEAARPMGDVTKPTKITSAKELAKAIPDKEWQKRIGKNVDFTKEYMVFFAWAGSGQDKLTFEVEEEKKQSVVVFSHSYGITNDLRDHFHLYALRKNATWRMADDK